MASRRQAPAPEPPSLPEHLRVPCWVEDWIAVDEKVRPWSTIDTADDLQFHLSLIARRRWKDAREAWAEERGMTWREFSGTYSHGRPRWRDWPVFLTARGDQ